MPKDTRRSGIGLVIAGAAGMAFFALTDPKWGMARGETSGDVVDAIRQASPGTWMGIAGGAVIVLFGFWLMLRRSA
jgi:hypothetical protein